MTMAQHQWRGAGVQQTDIPGEGPSAVLMLAKQNMMFYRSGLSFAAVGTAHRIT
jgi:hypothetical protein